MTSSSDSVGDSTSTLCAASAPAVKAGSLGAVPLLRRWHHVLGAALAWLILLVAVTGTVLVYKNQIVLYTVAGGAQAPAQGYDPQILARELDAILAKVPAEAISRLQAPVAERPYWLIVQRDGPSRVFELGTLEERTQHRWVLDVLDIIRALHVDLMLHEPGEWVLLALGLILLFFVVSGITMWWPSRRHFKPSKLVPRRMTRQQLLVSHRQLGVLLTPILVLTTLTGGVMIANGFIYQFTKPSAPTPAVSAEQQTAEKRPAALPASELLLNAYRAVPDATLAFAKVPTHGGEPGIFRMRLRGEWHPNGRTTVYVDGATGEVQPFQRADAASPGRRLLNQMYPLHSAYGLNSVYRFCIFLGGSVMIWLGISGFISWLSKRRKRSSKGKSRLT